MNKPNKISGGRAPLELVGLVLLAGVFIVLAVFTTAYNGGRSRGDVAQAPSLAQPTAPATNTPLGGSFGSTSVTVEGTAPQVGATTSGGSGTASSAGDELVATGPDGKVLPNNPALEPGDSVLLHFGGFNPGAPVGVILRSTPRNLGTISAAGDGAVNYEFTVPTNLEPGSHTLTFTGAADGVGTASTSRISAATVSNGVNTVIFDFTNAVAVYDLSLSSTVSAPLQPGASRTLFVTVYNPNPFAAQLYRIDVEVGIPSNTACSPEWVNVGHYLYGTGPKQMIPATSSVQVELPIELVDLATTDQSACKGATFPLLLTGQGVGD